MRSPRIHRLDERSLALAAHELANRDGDLAAALDRNGLPPLWAREPGFETLVRLILEQQVSLDSGRAAFQRLTMAVGWIDPETVVLAGEEALRAAGVTRQKTRYILALAEAVAAETVALDRFESMSDDPARAALVALTGIGPWTADCYLLFALGRPDVWPNGDLALATSVKDVKGLAYRPNLTDLAEISYGWRPWRGVAARMLWHDYLSARARFARGT